MSNEYLSIFLLSVCIILLGMMVYLGSKIHELKSDHDEQESKAKFWENQFKNFSKDEVINKEIILRKKYERLYYEACDKIDKLEDKRKNNGTKHKQRTSKGNPIKK